MTTSREQYMLNYFDSLRLLRNKQDELEAAAIDAALTDEERAEAAAAYLDFSSRIGLFKAAHEALMAKFMLADIQPPSEALVARTAELEQQLGDIIARQQEYSAMLKGVTDFINTWASLTTQRSTRGAAVTASPALREAAPTALASTSHLAFIGKA